MRQSFKVSFYLRSNYENKEGKSPVMLRIFLGGAMSNLRREHLVPLDGKAWIMTRRKKTSVESNILLLNIPKAIIEKYSSSTTSKGGKLFPILSNQKMDAYLKEIADVCGVQKRLTFHLARHTFAIVIPLLSARIK